MNRQIKWRSFIAYTIEGKAYHNDASFFNKDTSLLDRIVKMPKADKTISVYNAYHLYWEDIFSNLFDLHSLDQAGETSGTDWISWISKQGYQITLSGSEYEVTQA